MNENGPAIRRAVRVSVLRGGLLGILRVSVPVAMFVRVRGIGPSLPVGRPQPSADSSSAVVPFSEPRCVAWTRVFETRAHSWYLGTRGRRPQPDPARAVEARARPILGAVRLAQTSDDRVPPVLALWRVYVQTFVLCRCP